MQVMGLLHLPDEIQQYVGGLPLGEQRHYSGRRLGEIVAIRDETTLGEACEDLMKRLSRRARP